MCNTNAIFEDSAWKKNETKGKPIRFRIQRDPKWGCYQLARKINRRNVRQHIEPATTGVIELKQIADKLSTDFMSYTTMNRNVNPN